MRHRLARPLLYYYLQTNSALHVLPHCLGRTSVAIIPPSHLSPPSIPFVARKRNSLTRSSPEHIWHIRRHMHNVVLLSSPPTLYSLSPYVNFLHIVRQQEPLQSSSIINNNNNISSHDTIARVLQLCLPQAGCVTG